MIKFKNLTTQGSGKKNNIPPMVIVGTIALVGILLTCLLHVRHIRANLKDVISNQFESQMQVAGKALNGRMIDIETNIDGAVAEIEEIESRYFAEAQIKQALAKYATSDDIDMLLYLTVGGTAIYATGEKQDVSDRMKDISMITDDQFYVVNDFFKDQKGYMMLFVAPVIVKDEIRGIVIATEDCNRILQSDSFSGMESTGCVFLLDRKGHVLASTYPADKLKNSYDSITNFSTNIYEMTDKANEDIKALVLNATPIGKTLACHNRDGQDYYYSMVSLDTYKDIELLVVYDDEVFQLNDGGIIGSTVLTATIIMIAMLLFVLVELWNSARANKIIERYAFEDEITGGKNLNYFKREAEEILKKYKGMAFSIHRFDIANFRYINEAYGHEKADRLLKAIAEESALIFSSNEICVRITADQHVLLTKNTLDLEERLFVFSDKVNARALDIGIRYPIKLKRGVYKIQDTTEDISLMIDKANAARKELTGEEKECVAAYSDKMVKDMRKVDMIESTMESALFNGEFKMFVQPKWDIEKNCLYGGEALVRWIRSDGTMVYPSDFIPVFERNGFVEQLDMYMLECACQLVRMLADAGKPVCPISVNQSRVLIHNPQYLEKVNEVMKRYNIPKGSIELEVTETVLYMEQGKMISIMNSLKSKDIPISMDDFGSGYSSLNMLKDFPFDILKIDREFFSESITSEASILILTKIVEMADGLGIRVICEGVESKEQVEMLRDIGVRYVQGYYFSKPIPSERYLEKFCDYDVFAAQQLEPVHIEAEQSKDESEKED